MKTPSELLPKEGSPGYLDGRGSRISREIVLKTRCTIGKCVRPEVARYMCGMHYQRWHATGEAYDLEQRPCVACGTMFMPRARNQESCKRSCSGRNEARRRLGIEHPGFERKCWWCHTVFPLVDGRREFCKEECSRIGSLLYNIQRMYGVSREEYRAAYFAQDGLCLVCQRPERTARNTLLAVDHDHETNTFRGLLCSHCNRAVGLFSDDPDVMRAAADHVEKHRANH